MSRRRNPFPSKTRNTRRRNSRRAERPTFKEAILGANRRAQQKANRRYARRKKLTPVHASTDGMEDSMIHLTTPQRLWRWFLALLLIPFCIVMTRALMNVGNGEQSFWLELIRTRHFLFFSVGMFLMVGWFFTGLAERFFLYLYVLGHELTHAMFVFICGGNVSKISVSADGGYIMTNKSNVLIALSPYFVPFWSVVVLIISSLLGLVFDIPYHEEALYGLIGATWMFHLLWTLWMIPRDQPDLKENGVFFSLIVIYLANVVVISVLLCCAPGSLTWHHWFNEFLNAWSDLKKIPAKAFVLLG